METITLNGQRFTLTRPEVMEAHKLASMRLAGPKHAQIAFDAWLVAARDVERAIARRVAVGNALKLDTHQSVAVNSPALAAHPVAQANAASWPKVPLRGGRKTAEAAKVARTSKTIAVKRGGVMVEVPNPQFRAAVETVADKLAKDRPELFGRITRKAPKAMTARDMGDALFQSDVWPPATRGAAVRNNCADICSYITRVLLGRNLMLPDDAPVRVDLENGHHLVITLEKVPA